MKETNPFKRVLSGFLATAMMLSLVPVTEVSANQTNVKSAYSTHRLLEGTGNYAGSGLVTNYQNSLKVSLMWAPRSDDWAVDDEHSNNYEWGDPEKVVTVIDGMYIYQNELPDFLDWAAIPKENQLQSAIPQSWSVGSGLGYLTWQYAKDGNYEQAYGLVHSKMDPYTKFVWLEKSNLSSNLDYTDLDQSGATWYALTEDWSVDGALAQKYTDELGYMPKIFIDLEEWRSRIYNTSWNAGLVDSYNTLYTKPTFTTVTNTAVGDGGATLDYTAYNTSSSSPHVGTTLTLESAGLTLPDALFSSTDNNHNYDEWKTSGWYITENDQEIKSYYRHPHFINVMSRLVSYTGAYSGDGGASAAASAAELEPYLNNTLELTMCVAIPSLVTGALYDINMEVRYGQYKLMIEPVINRSRNYAQTAFSIKDTTMQYLSEVAWGYPKIEYGNKAPFAGGALNAPYYSDLQYSGTTSAAYQYLANAFQIESDEPYLGVTGVSTGKTITVSDDKPYYNDLWYLENQWGMYVFTFPAVPVEDVDPLPTIIKTYVEIDYDGDGNIQYESDGSIKYKWAAPSTLAATMSTTGKADWEDTGYVSLDGTVTQSPNIHLWESVAVYDDDRNLLEDPESDDYLSQRAYLNDVITLSSNVKSTMEDTEWTGELPTGLTLNGSAYGIEPTSGYITSYHFDLLMNATQFQEVTTSEEFNAGLATIDAKYPQVGDTFPKSWFGTSVVRYADDATSVTDVNPIKGANFIDEGGLMDHVKGYYKADQVYQTTSTVGPIDGMSGDYRYIPNTTLNYLMGFNEDGTEQVRSDARNEALTHETQSSQFGSSKYLTEEDPNPIDQQNATPNMMGSYEYGSNVTVLRYIVGEPPEVPIHID